MSTIDLALFEHEPFEAGPIPGSWWVVPGRFLAGPYPGAVDLVTTKERIHSLAEAGIDAVFNLQEEDETNSTGQFFLPYRQYLLAEQRELLYLRCPVRDMTPPSPAALRWIVDEIDRQLNDGKNVYVHCWGGHGRTGTVAGAWLIENGIDNKAVLAELARRREHNDQLREFRCPQTLDQERTLARWKPRSA